MDQLEEEKLKSDIQSFTRDYINACRLCLSQLSGSSNETSTGMPLFPLPNSVSFYIEVILQSIHIEIIKEDPLPKNICYVCVDKIESFVEFKKACEETQRKLAALLYPESSLSHAETKIENSDDTTHSKSLGEKPDSEVLVDVPSVIKAEQIDDKPQLEDETQADNNQSGKKSEETARKKKEPTIKYRKVCEECGLTFSTNCTLRRHRVTHTGQKNFACSICSNRFARKFHLEMHMRIHLKIRPHICETCASSFSTSSDLTRHRRIHVDIKNYACVVCERRFKRSSDVIKHMRTHTGQKPYSCQTCSKNYSSHSGLAKHLRRYHSTMETNNSKTADESAEPLKPA